MSVLTAWAALPQPYGYIHCNSCTEPLPNLKSNFYVIVRPCAAGEFHPKWVTAQIAHVNRYQFLLIWWFRLSGCVCLRYQVRVIQKHPRTCWASVLALFAHVFGCGWVKNIHPVFKSRKLVVALGCSITDVPHVLSPLHEEMFSSAFIPSAVFPTARAVPRC